MRARVLRTLTGAVVAGSLAVSLAACPSDNDDSSNSSTDDEADSYLTGPDEQIKVDYPEWEGKTPSAVGASTTWGVLPPGSVRVDPLMQLGFALYKKFANASASDNGHGTILP